MIVPDSGRGSIRARFARLVERWALKQRYVMEYPEQIDGPEYSVLECSPADLAGMLPGADPPERLAKLADQRAGSAKEFPLFVALDGDGAVMGYSFLFVPQSTKWHDSLPTSKGVAKETSSWVEEEFRGQGVRQSILSSQAYYCTERSLKFQAVIERSNLASIRSSSKAGAIMRRRNVLLKAFRRNIISVATNPPRVHILLGSRRLHR